MRWLLLSLLLATSASASVEVSSVVGGGSSAPEAGSPLPTATCTAGTLQYDADYLYVCAEADTWKRTTPSFYCSYVALLANPTFCADYDNVGDAVSYCTAQGNGGDAVTCSDGCATAVSTKYGAECS